MEKLKIVTNYFDQSLVLLICLSILVSDQLFEKKHCVLEHRTPLARPATLALVTLGRV